MHVTLFYINLFNIWLLNYDSWISTMIVMLFARPSYIKLPLQTTYHFVATWFILIVPEFLELNLQLSTTSKCSNVERVFLLVKKKSLVRKYSYINNLFYINITQHCFGTQLFTLFNWCCGYYYWMGYQTLWMQQFKHSIKHHPTLSLSLFSVVWMICDVKKLDDKWSVGRCYVQVMYNFRLVARIDSLVIIINKHQYYQNLGQIMILFDRCIKKLT